LAVPPERYPEASDALLAALGKGGFELRRAEPPAVTRLLGTIMQRLGGALIGAYVPDDVEFFRRPPLDARVYLHGVALSGSERAVARAHALIAEAATRTEALQTMSGA